MVMFVFSELISELQFQSFSTKKLLSVKRRLLSFADKTSNPLTLNCFEILHDKY